MKTNVDPIVFLIDSAIGYIRSKDPSWERVQPFEFRARVVERWKENIQRRLLTSTVIVWSLPIGDVEFAIQRPLFGLYDMQYNPYLCPSRKSLQAR